jgi:hypothetical protein
MFNSSVHIFNIFSEGMGINLKMNILSKLTDIVGGSLFKEIKEGVMAYFPPETTPEQKLAIEKFMVDKEIQTQRLITDAAAQLDKRIAEQEGTASDLKGIPILGPIILFLRGMQRPVWGFGTMIMDYKWFFEVRDFTEQQQTAMIIINVLVLGFLFGERSIKNLEPLLIKVFAKS